MPSFTIDSIAGSHCAARQPPFWPRPAAAFRREGGRRSRRRHGDQRREEGRRRQEELGPAVDAQALRQVDGPAPRGQADDEGARRPAGARARAAAHPHRLDLREAHLQESGAREALRKTKKTGLRPRAGARGPRKGRPRRRRGRRRGRYRGHRRRLLPHAHRPHGRGRAAHGRRVRSRLRRRPEDARRARRGRRRRGGPPGLLRAAALPQRLRRLGRGGEALEARALRDVRRRGRAPGRDT